MGCDYYLSTILEVEMIKDGNIVYVIRKLIQREFCYYSCKELDLFYETFDEHFEKYLKSLTQTISVIFENNTWNPKVTEERIKKYIKDVGDYMNDLFIKKDEYIGAEIHKITIKQTAAART